MQNAFRHYHSSKKTIKSVDFRIFDNFTKHKTLFNKVKTSIQGY